MKSQNMKDASTDDVGLVLVMYRGWPRAKTRLLFWSFRYHDIWQGGAFTKSPSLGARRDLYKWELGVWVALVEGLSLPGSVGLDIPDHQPLLWKPIIDGKFRRSDVG